MIGLKFTGKSLLPAAGEDTHSSKNNKSTPYGFATPRRKIVDSASGTTTKGPETSPVGRGQFYWTILTWLMLI
uniref:Uncharacterized protein n=1 Tax=Globodera rostochiensis TaxID=31243 RepID=A0A914I466_GLORO